MNFKIKTYEIITQSIENAVRHGKFPSDAQLPEVRIEYPREQHHGDTSTSFSLESAKILRRSPMSIGEDLKEYISAFKEIERVEVVKPGFINLFFSFETICNSLDEIVREKDKYGFIKKDKPEKINIEFVSANPTGPLNIVSARAAAIGDTLANILEANGNIVDREFYINDFGNQVRLLGESVLARINEIKGEKSEFPEEGYHGQYVKEIAQFIIDNFENEYEKITDRKELIDYLAVKAVRFNVESQRKDLEDFNVKFAKWFSERSLHESGEVTATLSYLEERGAVYEKEGRKIFRAADYGDDKDRVVVRNDGRPTYLLADIAYHRDKIKRGYDRIIDIWGPDHHGYIARLSGAMRSMGFDDGKFRVLIAQQVNLVMEDETVRMSKRLGNFSTMRELIDEIGVDAARYFFIMRSMESHLDFDLTLAKKESSENPVFYLQYAHARICSIFREAEKRGIDLSRHNRDISYLNNPESIYLIKLMIKFPEEVYSAGQSCEPHRISAYLMKLAQGFHKFYTEHRVLSDNLTKTSTYLTLVDSVRIVLKNGLRLLGISAPERM